MLFENHTPFPAIAWENVDASNHWHITTVARVKYALIPSEEGYRLQLFPDQGELFGEDMFYGTMGQSSIQYESDFVTYKPVTDIIVNAKAYLPSYATETQCQVEILDASKHLLRRVTVNVKSPYEKSKEPRQIALRYEDTYGGGYATPTEDDPYDYHTLDEYNPIGVGKHDKNTSKEKNRKPLIEFAEERFRQEPYPAGFGIINRAWKSRLAFAGTYDDDWLKNQHPLSPYNFKYKYNQAANPALQLDGYLDIHAKIALTNLTGAKERLIFRIPDVILFNEQHTQSTHRKLNTMHIDTILVDIENEDKKQWAVYISYRSFVKKEDGYKSISCHFLTKELLKEEA